MAVETIESIRLIQQQIPHVKAILGVSNITFGTFGLAFAVREVANFLFLDRSAEARPNLAVVNAKKLERFASIPEEESRLAKALLFKAPPIYVPADHPNARVLEKCSRR
jgi:5-methyltetrahydrofolate--homocysteine methyltransferase